MDPAVVAAISDIFELHAMTERFGIHLLHRHFELPPESLLLKSSVDDDITLTKITSIGSVDFSCLRGVLYMLNNADKFQAYEFKKGEPIDLPAPFLSEFRSAYESPINGFIFPPFPVTQMELNLFNEAAFHSLTS
jgi:hypothetical protein